MNKFKRLVFISIFVIGCIPLGLVFLQNNLLLSYNSYIFRSVRDVLPRLEGNINVPLPEGNWRWKYQAHSQVGNIPTSKQFVVIKEDSDVNVSIVINSVIDSNFDLHMFPKHVPFHMEMDLAVTSEETTLVYKSSFTPSRGPREEEKMEKIISLDNPEEGSHFLGFVFYEVNEGEGFHEEVFYLVVTDEFYSEIGERDYIDSPQVVDYVIDTLPFVITLERARELGFIDW